DFGVRGEVGLLDWYTLSVAVFATVALAGHGATYLALKTEGPVHERSGRWAKRLWAAAGPLFVAVSVESSLVRPDVPGPALSNPLCWLGAAVIGGAVLLLIAGLTTGREDRAFLGSNALLAGILATGGSAIYPVMLHSTLDPANSLTAQDCAAGGHA